MNNNTNKIVTINTNINYIKTVCIGENTKIYCYKHGLRYICDIHYTNQMCKLCCNEEQINISIKKNKNKNILELFSLN